MQIKINDRTELNSAVVKLRAHVIQMCNDTTAEDICNNFVSAKDLLVAIYKYNIEKQHNASCGKKIVL